MRRIEPSENIAHLLREFAGIGGVVDYDFFSPETNEKVDWQAHKKAIGFAYERWDAEYREHNRLVLDYVQHNQEYLKNISTTRRQEQERFCILNIENGFQADLEKLRGESITPYQFLGRTFRLGYVPLTPDQKSGALVSQSSDISDELKRLNVPIWPASTSQAGYAYAFSDPPYSLLVDGDKRLRMFRKLNHVVFDDFAPAVCIYQWTTDWCSYFDKGNHWWGSFLWTVYNPTQNFIVVIAASATD